MSEREFENYLTLLGSLLRLSTAQREAVASELRDHLEERVADLIARGVDADDAKQQAIAEFGDAARLAGELSRIAELKKRRWIMRMTTGTLAVAALLVFALLAFWPDRDGPALVQAQDEAAAENDTEAPPTTSKSEARSLGWSRRNMETSRKLKNEFSVEFTEKSFQKAIQDLGDQAGVQILLDHAALEFAGISLDTPVTFQMSAPVDTLLTFLLRNLQLTHMIEDGIVVITTPEEAENQLDTRIYDVSDILATRIGASQLDPESVVKATQGKTAELIDTLSSSNDSGDHDAVLRRALVQATALRDVINNLERWRSAKQREFKDLTEMIQGTIAPNTWEDIGGAGSIRRFRDYLVISQTGEVHRELESLLENLRGAMGDELGQERTLELRAEDFEIEEEKGGGAGGGF